MRRWPHERPPFPRESRVTDVPRGWDSAKLAELTEFVTSGSRGWAKHHADDGPLFLRIGNLDRDTIRIDLSDSQHVRPPEGAEGRRTGVKPGDILLSITADVGMVGLATANLGEVYVNQHVALLRPLPSVDSRGLAYTMLDPSGLQELARKAQYGATKPGLSLIQVRDFNVRVPPVAEQHRIVEAIESYLTRLDDAVASLERVQAKLKAYHASVLKAAVEGRLVPTEARPSPVLRNATTNRRTPCWPASSRSEVAAGKKPNSQSSRPPGGRRRTTSGRPSIGSQWPRTRVCCRTFQRAGVGPLFRSLGN